MWPVLIGMGVGALVGSVGKDHWGWSDDAPMTGAIVGGVGGGMYGASTAAGPAIGGVSGGANATGGASGIASKGAQAQVNKGLLGSKGLFDTMSMAGAGMNIAQAFGGGSSSGYAPADKIPLSPTAQKGQTALHKKSQDDYTKAKDGYIDPNIAAPIIGGFAKSYGSTRRAMGNIGAGVGSKSKYGTTGGLNVGGILSMADENFEGGTASSKWRSGMTRENLINALNQGKNIMSLENQTPLLVAQSNVAKSGFKQWRDIQRGDALGGAVEMLGMRSFNKQLG